VDGRTQSRTTTGEGLAVKVSSTSCTDVAGNTADAIESAAFKIDKTAPVILQHDFSPAANADGWHNSNITVRFSVSDALSGLNTACQTAFPDVMGSLRLQSKVITTEGNPVTVNSDPCTDVAGNAAAAKTSSNFKLDKTAPTVAITSPSNGLSTIVLSIAVSGTASDNLSGIKSVTLNGAATTYNSGAGTWTTNTNVALACGPNTLTTVATDNADLTSSHAITVTRLCFTFEYLRPIEQSYLGGGVIVNDGKYGRVIPVKGVVKRDGVPQTDADLLSLGLTLRIGVNRVACTGGSATDSVEEYADAGQSSGGTNIFRWTLDGFWIYNLDTKAPPDITMVLNNCYRLDAYVSDTATPPNKVKISESPYAIFRPVR
jgi:CheY-specific phosphatase CheX